jgi:hypothetical protein
MGTLTGSLDPQGPFIYATIMATPQHISALKSANCPVPQPVTVWTLLDTGSTGSILDFGLIRKFQLVPTGKTLVHTTTTGAKREERDQYDVSIFLTEQGANAVQHNVSIVGADLACEGLMAIIGWDILIKCCFLCDGPSGIFRLDF